MLKAFQEHGCGESEAEKTLELMTALAKSACMDMTLMFMEDQDKANLKKILQKLRASQWGKDNMARIGELEKKYTAK